MADDNGKTTKWIEIFLSTFLAGVGLLIAISGLAICQRVVIIIGVIALVIALVIFLRLISKAKDRYKIPITNGSPPPAIKYLAKNTRGLMAVEIIFTFVSVVSFLMIIFPEPLMNSLPVCATSKPTPLELPTPTVSLSDTHVEFKITFKDGSQISIPTDGILTLAPDDKIVVKVIVTSADGSPFPHELLFRYYSASGENIASDTATYVAKQSGGDIINTLIMDKVTLDQILRSLLVVVK